MEEKISTKDLGCAAFLHANNYPLKSTERSEKKFVEFYFNKPDNFPSVSEAIDAYYNNKPVKALLYWQSLKTLKNIIHERVAK